jgi:hypothetical protein
VDKVFDIIGLYLNPLPMLDFDSPERPAIFARDQWVAFTGVDSSVATTTSSTCSAVIETGRPGRG